MGGWYGMKKGLRGRFGVYMPPLMEALGLVEIDPRRQEQQDARDLGRRPGARRVLRVPDGRQHLRSFGRVARIATDHLEPIDGLVIRGPRVRVDDVASRVLDRPRHARIEAVDHELDQVLLARRE